MQKNENVELELTEFSLVELEDAKYRNKVFKKVKKNYKKLFYAKVNWYKVILSLIILIAFVFVLGNLLIYPMKIIILTDLGLDKQVVAIIIYSAAAIVLYKRLFIFAVNKASSLIYNQVETTEKKNDLFLQHFCKEMKMNKKEMFDYKEVYMELDKKWKKSNNYIIEISRNICALLVIIIFIFQIDPVIETIKSTGGDKRFLDSVAETIKTFFLLMLALQTIDMNFNQFSFEEIIKRYDYIINFGYDGYAEKYN